MVTGAAQTHDDGQNRRHTGRGRHRLLGTFQGGDALLESTHCRVGVARIDIARHFASKTRGSIGRGAEYVAGGWVDRLAVLTFWRAVLTGAHRQGIEADAVEIAVQTPGLPFNRHCQFPQPARRNGPDCNLVVVQVDNRADGLGLDLGGIVARLLDLIQVGRVDIAGHVLAVKHRAVEVVDLDLLAATDRFDQIRQILIDQPVGADQLADFLGGAAVRDQLMGAGHVDAVHVRITHRWCGRAEVHVLRPCFAGHLDNLLTGGAAHDGVIHQHHVLAAELQLDGVELLPYGFLAGCLARHDKGTTDITVLDEAFAELHAEMVGQFQCRGTAGIRNRDNHIDIVLRTLTEDLVSQLLAHAQPRLVHRYAIHDRVRTRQINVFEDARCVFGVRRALAGKQLAFFSDVHRFARREIANQGEAKHVEGDTFRGDHVFHAFVGMTLTEDDRANAVRVAETNYAVTGDHRDYRVATQAALVHISHGSEHVFFGGLQFATLCQLVSEHVKQHFRIGVGVHVTQVRLVDLLGQLLDVGQVAVVRQGDAIRRVDVERLRFGRAGATRRRVAHVANAHMADQTLHVALLEHVTYQTVVLAQEQTAIMAGDNTGSILAAVLEDCEPVIQRLIDVRFTDDTDNAAHVTQPLLNETR